MRMLAGVLSILFLAGAASAEVVIQSVRKQGGMAHLDLAYTNRSDTTYSMVKIVCAPPGTKSRRERGVIYLSNHLGGGIAPGYAAERTLQVPLKKGASPQDIACEEIPHPVRLP